MDNSLWGRVRKGVSKSDIAVVEDASLSSQKTLFLMRSFSRAQQSKKLLEAVRGKFSQWVQYRSTKVVAEVSAVN